MLGEGPGPLGYTIGPATGLREAWHRGRREYLAWLFAIDAMTVIVRARESVAQLGALVEPSSDDRLHVTVLVNGFPDELPLGLRAAQIRAVEEARLRAPLVRVHGPAVSFVSLHLAVCDCNDGIGALRRALLGASGALGHREPRESPYAAHVTAGNVTDSVCGKVLHDALASLTDASPIELRLTHLRLVALDTRSYNEPWKTIDEIVLT